MDLNLIPRSVRWRIQLGVYTIPNMASSSLSGLEEQKDDRSVHWLLDAIYKQNKASIEEQNERFQQLIEKHIEEEIAENEGEKVEDAAEDVTKIPDIDPLTAMVQEKQAVESRKADLLLKYKKERARRKRGLSTEARHIGDASDGIDRASLVIIEKDLKRLPHPTSNNGAASGSLTPEEETRINHLKDILYLYAQEHPDMGYRQGMHEVASYLLYALEVEKLEHPNDPLYDVMLSTCFSLLEKTLEQLHTAYDGSGQEGLKTMSNSILGKIRQNDEELFRHLTTSPQIPPPPIYCVRWVRLLFSREVVGFENVFLLWDVFFQYEQNLMRALEVASAARILLLRDALFNPLNSPLDLLMNVPPQKVIAPWINLIKKLMAQEQADAPIKISSSDMIVVVPSSPAIIRHQTPPEALRLQQQQQQQQYPQPQQPPARTLFQSESFPEQLNASHNNGQTAFSFSKMKDSFGKKSESLRKKIATATNEWKRENSNGSQQPYPPHMSQQQEQEPQPSFQQLLQPQTPQPQSEAPPPFFDLWNAAGDVLRQTTTNKRSSNASSHSMMPEPPSPRKHQHAQWSQGMSERLLVLQNYLMTVESSTPDDSEKVDKIVPADVWEAMADLQRMQQELHNYSMNMT